MAVKTIYPREIYGTPQVNILNDNVLESVDYSYNKTTMPYQTIGTIEFTGHISNTDNNNNIVSVTNVSENKTINPEIYDVSIVRRPVTLPQVQEEVVFKQDFDISQYFCIVSESDPLTVGNPKMDFFIEFDPEHSGFSNTTEQADFSIALNSLYYYSNIVYKDTKKLTLENHLLFLSSDPYRPPDYSGAIKWKYLLSEFSVDIKARCISTEQISVDTNSPLTLESNELIQDGTHFVTPEQKRLWKDIVPQEIVKQYKNGKATMSLQAIYDGTNEYAVGDLVIPMKSDTEPVLKQPYSEDYKEYFGLDDFKIVYGTIDKDWFFSPNQINITKEIPLMERLVSVSFVWRGGNYPNEFSGEKTWDIPLDIDYESNTFNRFYMDYNLELFLKPYYSNGTTTWYCEARNYPDVDELNITITYAGHTPKKFEVTSNEIVYTGKSVQNLELVEYVEVTE